MRTHLMLESDSMLDVEWRWVLRGVPISRIMPLIMGVDSTACREIWLCIVRLPAANECANI
jgi:hypothetical protein